MLKIWGRPNSVNVQKAMWTIAELGLEHEHALAGGEFGQNDQDWYLAMNPNGRVPVIDDDGFVLWESNAIVRYLAEKHGTGTLLPDTVVDRALANQWMDWQQTVLIPAMTPIFMGLVRTAPEDRDMAAIDESAKETARVLGLVDAWLEGRDHMVGERFTIADIPVGAATYRWYGLDVAHPDYPRLRAWYQRLSERAAYQDHVMLQIT